MTNKKPSMQEPEKFTFREHSEVSFVQVSPDAPEHEKSQTPLVDARSLRNISEMARPIKGRIDSGDPGEGGPLTSYR